MATRRDLMALSVVALAVATGLGISLTRPFEAPLEPPIRSFASASETQLWDLLNAEFGPADAPTIPAAFAEVVRGDAQRGRELYEVQCLHCHGADGYADTYTARLLTPKPRDFHLGVVKFTTTAIDAPPRQEDLERTLERGLEPTAMSSFANLEAEQRTDLAAYVMNLLIRGAVFEDARVRLEQQSPADALAQAVALETKRWTEAAAASIDPPARPQLQAADAGLKLFQSSKAGCFVCHGNDGRGLFTQDTPALSLLDIWGEASAPRDLREGPLLGGENATDLYWRISSGIKGTPMPPMEDLLSPEEIWSLVSLVQSWRAE
jgi:mono/diheme cytochrome c family protein